MKIGIASDLHLEFRGCELKNNEGVDVLVLAGDICKVDDIIRFPFNQDREQTDSPAQYRSSIYKEFFSNTIKEFPKVIVVAGNHEHYGGQFHKTIAALQENLEYISPNFHVLNNDSVTINDTVFVGSTLWTDLNNGCPITDYHLGSCMSDYRVITFKDSRGNYRKLRPRDTLSEHITSASYIKTVLDNCTETGQNVVVVSHHAPCSLSIHETYKDDHYMNGGYVSNLENLLYRNSVKLWCHGHVHNQFDYYVGDARVVCNPRGYPNELSGEYEVKVVEL